MNEQNRRQTRAKTTGGGASASSRNYPAALASRQVEAEHVRLTEQPDWRRCVHNSDPRPPPRPPPPDKGLPWHQPGDPSHCSNAMVTSRSCYHDRGTAPRFPGEVEIMNHKLFRSTNKNINKNRERQSEGVGWSGVGGGLNRAGKKLIKCMPPMSNHFQQFTKA